MSLGTPAFHFLQVTLFKFLISMWNNSNHRASNLHTDMANPNLIAVVTNLNKQLFPVSL